MSDTTRCCIRCGHAHQLDAFRVPGRVLKHESPFGVLCSACLRAVGGRDAWQVAARFLRLAA